MPVADTSLVALQLNKISCLALKRITVSDWARAARDPGDYVEPVEEFFDWHESIQDLLEKRLEEFPDEIENYMQMEKVNATIAILNLFYSLILIAAFTREKPDPLGCESNSLTSHFYGFLNTKTSTTSILLIQSSMRYSCINSYYIGRIRT